MKLFDSECFFRYLRMSPTTFEKLLSWVAPRITKKDTKMRESISAQERLCVTLRYLVTGDAQITIATNYRMSPSVVGRIILETSNAIWSVLKENQFVEPPRTQKEWEAVAHEFYDKWNFPNVLGAIDGKLDVVMQAPANAGSGFFNYKKQHSIVLMAVSSASYQFLLVDIGDSGRQSDGSVYHNRHLGYAIENNLIDMPSKSFQVRRENYPMFSLEMRLLG